MLNQMKIIIIPLLKLIIDAINSSQGFKNFKK